MRTSVAFGHFLCARDEEALSWAQTAFRERPNFTLAAGIAAASAALSGRSAEADKAMASLRQMNPGLRLSNLRGWLAVQQPRDFDRWAGGLRQVGLPEK